MGCSLRQAVRAWDTTGEVAGRVRLAGGGVDIVQKINSAL